MVKELKSLLLFMAATVLLLDREQNKGSLALVFTKYLSLGLN
jgi:hypothetical protein